MSVYKSMPRSKADIHIDMEWETYIKGLLEFENWKGEINNFIISCLSNPNKLIKFRVLEERCGADSFPNVVQQLEINPEIYVDDQIISNNINFGAGIKFQAELPEHISDAHSGDQLTFLISILETVLRRGIENVVYRVKCECEKCFEEYVRSLGDILNLSSNSERSLSEGSCNQPSHDIKIIRALQRSWLGYVIANPKIRKWLAPFVLLTALLRQGVGETSGNVEVKSEQETKHAIIGSFLLKFQEKAILKEKLKSRSDGLIASLPDEFPNEVGGFIIDKHQLRNEELKNKIQRYVKKRFGKGSLSEEVINFIECGASACRDLRIEISRYNLIRDEGGFLEALCIWSLVRDGMVSFPHIRLTINTENSTKPYTVNDIDIFVLSMRCIGNVAHPLIGLIEVTRSVPRDKQRRIDKLIKAARALMDLGISASVVIVCGLRRDVCGDVDVSGSVSTMAPLSMSEEGVVCVDYRCVLYPHVLPAALILSARELEEHIGPLGINV